LSRIRRRESGGGGDSVSNPDTAVSYAVSHDLHESSMEQEVSRDDPVEQEGSRDDATFAEELHERLNLGQGDNEGEMPKTLQYIR
jgi:hypothetical protein